MRTFLICSAILLTILLANPLLAQEKQAKDYARGFDKFLQLGLPDVKNATYMHLQDETGFSGIPGMMQFDRTFSGVNLSGNAWLLSSYPDGRHIFLKNGGSTVQVYDQKVLEKERENKKKEAVELPSEKSRKGASWKPADLDKDIQALLEYLRKPKDGKSFTRYEMEYGGWGNVFLMAVHFNRKGYNKEAGQIVDLLFQDAGDSRRVILQALNRLADAQYAEAYQSFCLTANWIQFDKALDRILTRFPSHWKIGPAVQRLSDQVKTRVQTKEPPPLVGEGLTPEDQKLARELAEAGWKEPNRMDFQTGLWILERTSVSGSEANSPLARIRSRKIRAFPLLMAMVNDTYLTAMSRSSMNHYQSSSEQEGPPSEEEIQMMYDRMQRPATRGELARNLLEAIVLSQEDQSLIRNKDPEAIFRLSRAWYQKNKDKTEAEILQGYLGDQEQSRKMLALQILVNSAKDDDAQVLEKYFLESKDVSNDFGYVTQFVMKRSNKAGEFVQKYLARIKKNPSLLRPREGIPDEMAEQMKGETDRMVAALQDLASIKTAQAIIDEVVASSKKWTRQEWRAEKAKLVQKLIWEGPQKSLAPLLQAALKTEDPFLATEFLTLVGQLPFLRGFMGMDDSPSEEGEPGKESPAKFDVQSAADLWKKLLADKRPIERGLEEELYEEVDEDPMTLGQFAARIFENLSQKGGAQFQEDRSDLAMLESRVFPVYTARAEARLAGKTDDQLPRFPSVSNVTPERRAQIKVDLQTAEAASSLRQTLDTLSLDDWMVLPQIVGEDEKLRAILKPLAATISVTKVKIDDAEVRQQVKDLEGKPFDRKTAENLLEISRNLAKKGVSSKLVVRRNGLLDGVGISLREWPPPGRDNPPNHSGFGNKAMIRASMRANAGEENQYGEALWLEELPEAAKLAPPADGKSASASKGRTMLNDDVLVQSADEESREDRLETQQADFWTKVESLFKPEFGPCGSYHIDFISTLPSRP